MLAGILPQLKDIIATGRPRAEGALDGMTVAFTEPYKVMMAGSFGAGKSTLTNMIVDPTGDTEVAREGNGPRGETQDVRRVFPGQDGSCQLPFRGKHILIHLFDTPGFNDPDRPDSTTLRLLSEATLDVALGMDAIIHTVKMGRMTEGDRNLPELLIRGLADTDEKAAELARRWIIIVTHCDSQRRPVREYDIEQFRGAMSQWFPPILSGAVERALFVENDVRRPSAYADGAANQQRILSHVVSARQVYHKSFKSVPMQDMILQATGNALREWPDLQQAMSPMTAHEIGTLHQFFKTIVQQRRFVPMTDATPASDAFKAAWNSLSIALRDEVAQRIAESVIQCCADEANKKMRAEVSALLAREQREAAERAKKACTIM